MCSTALKLVHDNPTLIRLPLYEPEFVFDTLPGPIMLDAASADYDPTAVEITDTSTITIQQVDERGETQTIVMSPRMAIELRQLLNTFLPEGTT
jgi:hypothetical protein